MRFAILPWVGFCLSSTSATSAEPVDFVKQIRPFFEANCIDCHNETKRRGGLRLDRMGAALEGGKHGPLLVPGSAKESLLIQALAGTGGMKRMPKGEDPLGPEQIGLIARWIDEGAKFPAEEKPKSDEPDSRELAKENHWSFQPITRPDPPAVSNVAWVRNPIDRFVLARLEAKDIAPSPESDRATLIRRASLDLLGLPPAPEEIDAFLLDNRPDAYERLIDRLLDSPHYGERWGRHWLDAARYADSNGYSIDAPRSIWPYRDWVINALNADMPFDQFTIEQIAGDLLPNAAQAQLVPTGFHRNTGINQEGGIDKEQFRVESIVDRVNTTGSVWLGLTINCVQCHEHKFDPIEHREYYELFAFFNNVDEPTLEVGSPAELARRDAVLAQVRALEKELKSYEAGLPERLAAWERALTPAQRVALTEDVRKILDVPADKRDAKQKETIFAAFKAQDEGLRQRKANLDFVRKRRPKLNTTLIVRERSKPRETRVHIQGDFTRTGERVTPAVPDVLGQLESGRRSRLDFARWLVDPKNPLTARVTVNRIWQCYFGKGIVETENDFGTQGSRPTHPELLDWLASEFVARGWSLKAMHRLITTSATYRQSSNEPEDLGEIDPNNALLARQQRIRLDAEVVRDAALAASGLLTPTVGGPSVFPPQPDGVMTLGQMNRRWEPSTGAQRYRRAMYTFFWRATPHPALIVFDAPDATSTCTRRNRSNTPLQALTLLNDEGFVEFARGLARRVLTGPAADDVGRIRYACRLCLGREPAADEAAVLSKLLAEQRRQFAAAPKEAQTLLAKAGTNSPPAGELAAWTIVGRVLLNTDEFITRE